MKIKKGDNVVMLSGKDRGKTGAVMRTDPTAGRVIVQGLNMVKRHLKPRKGGQKGQIVSIERWVSAAAVGYVAKETGKATRLGWQLSSDRKTKVRVDKKTGVPV